MQLFFCLNDLIQNLKRKMLIFYDTYKKQEIFYEKLLKAVENIQQFQKYRCFVVIWRGIVCCVFKKKILIFCIRLGESCLMFFSRVIFRNRKLHHALIF